MEDCILRRMLKSGEMAGDYRHKRCLDYFAAPSAGRLRYLSAATASAVRPPPPVGDDGAGTSASECKSSSRLQHSCHAWPSPAICHRISETIAARASMMRHLTTPWRRRRLIDESLSPRLIRRQRRPRSTLRCLLTLRFAGAGWLTLVIR